MSHVPVIVACRIPLLRAPGTERPFRTGFCAKSAFTGAVVIRNDTAAPRRRFWDSRRLVSTSFRPGRAKRGHGRRSAINLLVPARTFLRDFGTLRTFAVSARIFVARFLRVLRSEFSDSRGWIPLGLACTFPGSTFRFVKPCARWSGKRSRERRRQHLLLPG